MTTWLFIVVISVACVLLGTLFIFALLSFWSYAATASNMNKMRDSLTKADKNKTYRVGIYVEGDLSEVFLSVLKNRAKKYKLPLVFVPLHRLAARNLYIEGKWFNRIAYPEDKIVNLVALVGLRKYPCRLVTGKKRIFESLEMGFYYPNGAPAGYYFFETMADTYGSLTELGYAGIIRLAKAMQRVVCHPAATPQFAADPDCWPYDDTEKNIASAQNTPR